MWTKIFLRVGVFILCHFSPSFLWRCIKSPAGVFVPSLPLSLSIAIHFLSVRHPRDFSFAVDGRNCGYLYLFYLNCLCLRRARERAEEKSGELRRKANDLSRNNKQEKLFFPNHGKLRKIVVGRLHIGLLPWLPSLMTYWTKDFNEWMNIVKNRKTFASAATDSCSHGIST